MAIADITGDGLGDIVFTTGYANDPANDQDLFVLPRAAGGFGPLQHYDTSNVPFGRPSSLAVGDVTGDGRPDVVVALDRVGLEIFPGLANGTLGAFTFIANADSSIVAIGRFDNLPGMDVAGIGWGSDTVTTFSGGAGGLTKIATYPVQHDGYDDLEIGDVTGDGLHDLVVMSGQGQAPSFSVLPQLAAGGFGAATSYSVGTGSFMLTHGIGLGDVTGDGRNDVVASYGGNSPTSKIAVFAQTASGTLAAPVVYTSYDIPEPVEVGDLDFDGRAEVVVVHGGWNAVGVYGGRSDGLLDAETLYGVPYASHYSVKGVAIGDVTGDGSPDIVEADYNNGLILLANTIPAPKPTVPSAPSILSAIGGDRSVAVAWNAPASNGGTPITSYTATASPGGATCVVTVTSCTIGGLVNGTTYTVTVHATNTVGSSPESAPLAATPRTVPSAPRSVTAKAAGTGITVKWTAPASNGGAAITGYRIYRGTSSSSGILVATVTASAVSFVDTGAPRKATSYYWVTAINVVGESARSNVVSAKR
ncbi:MAG TPA: FG-GAP-like repeat-containing protein [Candidatus Limnocylindrales bacterium]|nr:FG-GAP-like repeat-containing protein [Candidatus Limnocylindrales bacterium]